MSSTKVRTEKREVYKEQFFFADFTHFLLGVFFYSVSTLLSRFHYRSFSLSYELLSFLYRKFVLRVFYVICVFVSACVCFLYECVYLLPLFVSSAKQRLDART